MSWRVGRGWRGGPRGGSRHRGDQRDAIAGLDTRSDEAARAGAGFGGEFGIGVGANEIGAGIMKIHALFTQPCVIKGFTQRAERRAAAGQRIECRR